MITVAALRKLVRTLDGITEQPHFEMTSFRVKKKILLTLNESGTRACIKLTPEDQDLFTLHDKTAVYPVPNKWGKLGWTFVELKKVRAEALKEMVKTAYTTLSAGKAKVRSRKKQA